MTLTERAASARPEETRGLLVELAEHVWGDKFERAAPATAVAFGRLGGINTPESLLAAAMMLRPEGWLIVNLSELGHAGGCGCTLGNPGTGQDVTADAGEGTLALALIAAIAAVHGV